MDIQESLCLPRRLESTHAPLSHPGWLMRKLCSVVGIPGCDVNRVRGELSVCDRVAPQLIRHYFPWLTAMHYQ
jgi:hypothetical protein